MSIIEITPNSAVTEMQDELFGIRTTVAGSFFVKKAGRKLLKHPSSVDTTSDDAVERYAKYKDDADFDDFTQTTLSTLIGKMKIGNTHIEMPSVLEYLREDSDGDGLSLKGLLNSTSENLLAVKWHIWLADYQGLSDVNASDLSITDKEKLNPRATIKQYSRENVIDWDFERVNGTMQLTYILLREVSSRLDRDTLVRERVVSYLKLAVDEIGYYQQKYVEADGSGFHGGEPNYVEVGGDMLKFIPLEIVIDSETQGGHMPLKAGYLSSISTLALSRYRVSATYKEALSSLLPTIYVYGMDEHAIETFETVNKRRNLASGPLNPNYMPRSKAEMGVEMLESSASLEQFERFFDRNEALVKAEGGTFKTDSKVQRTATEIVSESEQQSNVLEPMTQSLESSLERVIAYCGMFEGIYEPDNLQAALDDISVTMNHDFAISKLSVEEMKELREMRMSGNLTQKLYLELLSRGGVEVGDIEQLLSDLANEAPGIV